MRRNLLFLALGQVLGISALWAMSWGGLYSSVGWSLVNFVTLPFIAMAGGVILFLKFRYKYEMPSEIYS